MLGLVKLFLRSFFLAGFEEFARTGRLEREAGLEAVGRVRADFVFRIG